MERGHLKFQHVKKGDGPPHRGYPDMKHGHVSWYIEEVERDNQKTAVEQAKEGGQVTSLARYDDSQSRIKIDVSTLWISVPKSAGAKLRG